MEANIVHLECEKFPSAPIQIKTVESDLKCRIVLATVPNPQYGIYIVVPVL